MHVPKLVLRRQALPPQKTIIAEPPQQKYLGRSGTEQDFVA